MSLDLQPEGGFDPAERHWTGGARAVQIPKQAQYWARYYVVVVGTHPFRAYGWKECVWYPIEWKGANEQTAP